MDVKAAIAAVPLLRRLWRWLPGPLKLPVLVLGAIYALSRWRRGDDGRGEPPSAGVTRR